MLIVASTYAASLVAHQCAEELVGATWARIKGTFSASSGREVSPADVTGDDFAELVRAPELVSALAKLLEGSSALRRLAQVRMVFRDAAILWCDDHPTNNDWETSLFEELGARVVRVRDNREAVGAARASDFDLVLSDIHRDQGASGLELPAALGGISATPLVFYVGAVDDSRPLPPGCFGLTAHPEELLHLACDVLERSRM